MKKSNNPGWTLPMFTCVFQRYVAATVLVLKHSASFTEGADSMRVKGVKFGGHI